MNPADPAAGPEHAIVLVRPRYPENIGAAARIACNFGLSRLLVVTDEEHDQERMLKMATHKAAHLIQSLQRHATLAEAVAPYHFVVGTTARSGRHRTLEQDPRAVMGQVAKLAAAGNRIALVFGPENTGLTNAELNLCQFSSRIPTADFSSLNLAQAVAIHCYEFHCQLPAQRPARGHGPEYATSHELEGMYEHIDRLLGAIDFLKRENHAYWMRYIRQFLGRVRLTKKEASLIRGVCRKLLWYEGHTPEERRALAARAETAAPRKGNHGSLSPPARQTTPPGQDQG